MKWNNLTLIGTSHIAQESITRITHAFEETPPAIVCVELDPHRLSALTSGTRSKPTISDIARVGIKGYLFSILGAWAERKLGQAVGTTPGHDMLHAVHCAKTKGIPVALIDQDISITLKALSRHLTWKEKGRFVWDIIRAACSRPQQLPFDLHTIPKPRIVRKLTLQVQKRYPNVYKVLVTDRNEYMARKLAALTTRFPDSPILAIVGAGHESEIIRLVKKWVKTEKQASKTAL